MTPTQLNAAHRQIQFMLAAIDDIECKVLKHAVGKRVRLTTPTWLYSTEDILYVAETAYDSEQINSVIFRVLPVDPNKINSPSHYVSFGNVEFI